MKRQVMLDDRQLQAENAAAPSVHAGVSTEDQNPALESSNEADGINQHEDEVVDGHWRTEAGRKGARRVHQLIRLGRLYEQEHGLKGGRQRLRQLIGEGKLYELEHGLHATPGRESRMPRLNSREALTVLLESLSQLV